MGPDGTEWDKKWDKPYEIGFENLIDTLFMKTLFGDR
jgi:hypothetical protein